VRRVLLILIPAVALFLATPAIAAGPSCASGTDVCFWFDVDTQNGAVDVTHGTNPTPPAALAEIGNPAPSDVRTYGCHRNFVHAVEDMEAALNVDDGMIWTSFRPDANGVMKLNDPGPSAPSPLDALGKWAVQGAQRSKTPGVTCAWRRRRAGSSCGAATGAGPRGHELPSAVPQA
jgi:hypothetical protein